MKSLSEESKLKWKASAVAGVLFLVLSSPMAYRLTDTLTKYVGFKTADVTYGYDVKPRMAGVLLHGLVFGAISRGLMEVKPTKEFSFTGMPTANQKNLHALLATALFMVVGNPFTFKLTSRLATSVSTKSSSAVAGCVTVAGLLIHTLVFILLTRAVMEIKFTKDPFDKQ